MALSRNARRAVAKQRAEARFDRLVKRAKAHREAEKRAIVIRNTMNRPSRNYYPQSCLAGIEGLSHRGYVCTNATRANMTGRDK